MDKRAKKILNYGVRLVVGGIIVAYWYYYLKGWVPQSGVRFLVLSAVTFIYIMSFFSGRTALNKSKDDLADEPGGGGHEPL